MSEEPGTVGRPESGGVRAWSRVSTTTTTTTTYKYLVTELRSETSSTLDTLK